MQAGLAALGSDRQRRRLRVELVRVVEHGGLGGTRRAAVVVRRDRVEELGEHLRLDAGAPLLDEPEPEMDVTEQRALLRRPERRPATELARRGRRRGAARREEEVGAQPGVELRRLAAERRDADRVLEQPARVTVMALGAGRREDPRSRPDGVVASSPRVSAAEPRVGDLRRRGTRGTPRARRRRGGAPARARPGRRPPPRASARGAEAARRTRSTWPSTRTASPSSNRRSRSSTSSQTRASTRPLGSTSSSTRYGLPPRVLRRCLRATAYTPSTVRSASSSRIAVISDLSLGRSVMGRLERGRRPAVPRAFAYARPTERSSRRRTT